MPRALPEIHDDVVAIAPRREASFAHVARDFGLFESCAQRRVKIAEFKDGIKPG